MSGGVLLVVFGARFVLPVDHVPAVPRGRRARQRRVHPGAGAPVVVDRVARVAFLARVIGNAVLVALAEWLLGREGGNIDAGNTLFFLCLISLITTLPDRYRPVLATRVMAERSAAV